jgi:effector-binding domain-containing protein
MPASQFLLATALPRPLAAVRRQARPATLAALIRGSGVWDLLRARDIETTGHNVVVYWDEPGRSLMHSPEGIAVDIGVEVLAPFDSDADLISTATPAGPMVSALHVGPYEELGRTYRALLDYCRARNIALAGPYWEYYGHWTDDPHRLETTVSYLVRT